MQAAAVLLAAIATEIPHPASSPALRCGYGPSLAYGSLRAPLAPAWTSTSSEWLVYEPPRAALYPLETEDYALTLGLFAAALGVSILIDAPPAGWKRDLPGDAPLRDLIGATDPAAKARAVLVGDVLQAATVAYPFAVDAGVLALYRDGDPDLAWRITWTNLEASAIAAFFVVLTKKTVGRVRPGVLDCGAPGDFACRDYPGRSSFVSGHATAAFTSAGLACAHHAKLSLLGEPFDSIACAGTLALASATSALRVTADRHYATDVLAGAALGLLSGFAATELFHAGGSPSDGPRLSGAIHLSAIGAAGTLGRKSAASAGLELGLRRLFWIAPHAPVLSAAEVGVLAHALVDGGSRRRMQGVAYARGWAGPFAVGAALEGARRKIDGDALGRAAAGPEIAFAALERDDPVVVSLRWLPLLGGSRDSFAARLEVGLARWLAFSAEVETLHDRQGRRDGGLFLLGAGGRIPW